MAKGEEVVTYEEYEYETDSDDSDDDEEYEEVEEVVEVQKAKPAKNTKQPEPCGRYRVDTKAAKFGDCVCGWAKTAHEGPKVNKAKVALDSLRKSTAAQPGSSGGDGPCKLYRTDVSAAEFGTCVCGYARAAHNEVGENPARRALKSLRSTKELAAAPSSGEPCGTFVADVKASSFGICRNCGFPKARHTADKEDAAAVMLRNLREKNKARHEEEDRLARGLSGDESDEDGPKTTKKKSKKAANSAGDGPSTASAGGCCIVM